MTGKNGTSVTLAGVEERTLDQGKGGIGGRALRHRLIDRSFTTDSCQCGTDPGKGGAAAQQIRAVAINGNDTLRAIEDATLETLGNDDDRAGASSLKPALCLHWG